MFLNWRSSGQIAVDRSFGSLCPAEPSDSLGMQVKGIPAAAWGLGQTYARARPLSDGPRKRLLRVRLSLFPADFHAVKRSRMASVGG
ncbi:hypothetical protein D9M72_359350 [compost metagenome]